MTSTVAVSSDPASIGDILRMSPVMPVVTILDVAAAVPVARALAAGGIGVIELTLRTPSSLDSLRRIADEVPEIVVGAGTVLSPRQADEAVEAGARFLVSPGCIAALLHHREEFGAPLLPGVATVSEVLTAVDAGLSELKFFPAAPAGGPEYLRAIGAPVPQVAFCPTGGISAANAADYLALSNVVCVGGSWLTPAAAIENEQWSVIRDLAQSAAALTGATT